jgi:CubicO group peptidase (beta-lactamase class C family)
MDELRVTKRAEHVGMSSERLARIGPWMKSYVTSGKLPWAMTLVARHGEIAFVEAVGEGDVEAEEPIATDAILRFYSMSKPITAVAALMLYEEGRFQMDDPVGAYIPALAAMEVRTGSDGHGMDTEPAERAITVRDLFMHTSGLTYGFSGGDPLTRMYLEKKTDFEPQDGPLAEVVARLGELPLDHHPGARWTYGVSIDVLGHLVEVVSGRRFDRFLKERLFDPLGMTDTFFELPADRMPRYLPCYEQEGERFRRVDGTTDSLYAKDVSCFSGGGGLLSTMHDYHRFTEMLRRRGELDGERVLGARTVDFMAMNHLPGDLADMGQATWNETTFEGIGFGLGVSVVVDPAKAQVMASNGEYAWGGMASTAFWVDPKEDMTVIFATQLIPSSAYPLRRELRVLVNQALID